MISDAKYCISFLQARAGVALHVQGGSRMADQTSLVTRLARQWESPPTWLGLFLALALAQSRLLPLLPLGVPGRVFGAVLIAAGMAVFLMALAEFRRHRTTVFPRETPSALIDGGIYRWSRNPIYLADALILSGFALWWDAASLLLVPLFMAVIRTRFIAGEETVMRARFGAAYEGYATRVRRWL
jgi:protein-S-isoprenylcysteine O-methyltransferase Ste14